MKKTVDIYTYCGMDQYDFQSDSYDIIQAPIHRHNIKKYLSITEPILFKIYACFDVFDQSLLHFRDDIETIQDGCIVVNDIYINHHGGDKKSTVTRVTEDLITTNIKQLTVTFKFIATLRKKGIHNFKLVNLDYKKILPDYNEILRHYISIKRQNFSKCEDFFNIIRKYISTRDRVLKSCINEPLETSLELISNFKNYK